MILIWGFRARGKAISSGEFFCPRCGADRSYVLQQIRRWFTLFFIPLFPVGKVLGEQVKCSTCGTCFRPEVLETPTSAAFSENLSSAMRVSVIFMLAAGDPANGAARNVAVAAARESGVDSYEDDWITNDLNAIEPARVPEYLAPLAQSLNTQGKETFIAQVARVGLADGPLTPPELQVLESLGGMLGLSAAHLRGIAVTASGAPQAPSPDDLPGESRPN